MDEKCSCANSKCRCNQIPKDECQDLRPSHDMSVLERTMKETSYYHNE